MGQPGFAPPLFFGLEGHSDVSQNDDQSVPDEPGSDTVAGA